MASFYVPQYEDEAFWRYFTRLQDPLLVPCNCELWEICEAVYEGLNHSTRLVVEDMFNGTFRSLPYGQAWDYYHWLSKDTYEWDRAMGFQNLGCSTSYNPNSITLNLGCEDNMNFNDDNQQNDYPLHHPQNNQPPQYIEPTQTPTQGPSRDQGSHMSSLTEEMLNMLTKNFMSMQGETRASIKDLERQLDHVSGLLERLESRWESSELQIQKESNPKPHFVCFEDEDTVIQFEKVTLPCVNEDVVEENTSNYEVLVKTNDALMSMETCEVSYGKTSPILLPHVSFSTKFDLIPSFPLFQPHFINAPLLEESPLSFDPHHLLVQNTKEVKAYGNDTFSPFSSFQFSFFTSHFLISSFVSPHSFPNRPSSPYSTALTLVFALLVLFTNLVHSDFWAVSYDKLLRSLQCYLLNNT